MAKLPSVDMMDIWRNGEPKLSVHISRGKEFLVRIWLAKRLIALACWIAYIGLEFDESEGEATA